ncbi:MAG: response regulator [Elusimicrobiota bacterium]
MANVLIFDDDAGVGTLVAEVVRNCGLTAEHHLTAGGIVDVVREAKPWIVILDVMMPGLDGLSACHAIRANSATRHVKIVMLTSKNSAVDQAAAKRYGADLYLTKPFSISALAATLLSMLGDAAPAAPPPRAPAAPMTMTVLPGGIVLETEGRWFVLDAGAGVGSWIETRKTAPREAFIFLSRYSPDATSELDKTGLLLSVGTTVRVMGPDSPETLLNHLAPRMSRGAGVARSLPLLHPLRESEITLYPGVFATAFYTLYPGLTMGYRLDLPNRKVVYCPAHVPNPDPATADDHDARKFRKLFANADLMLHGFSRSIREPGEGAAWEVVQDHAAYAGVKQLLLFPLPGAAVSPNLAGEAAARAELLKLDCRLWPGR